MKILFQFLTIVTLFYSCNNYESQKKYQVKLIVDKGFSEYLDFPNIDKNQGDSMIYDSINMNFIFYFNNIAEGLNEITFVSYISDNYQKVIDIHCDTTLKLKINLTDKLEIGNIKDLKNFEIGSDTVYISHNTVYCIGGGKIEKFKIYKSKNDYCLEYFEKEIKRDGSTKYLKVMRDSTIKTHIDKVIIDYISGDSFFCGTTYTYPFVRKGNFVYKFSQQDLKQLESFNDLKHEIGLQGMNK